MVKEIIECASKNESLESHSFQRTFKIIKLSRPIVEKCPFDGGTFLENVYLFDKNSLLGYHMFSTPI